MRKTWKTLVKHLKDAQHRFKEGLILHPWRYMGGFSLLIILCVVLYWAIFADASPVWTGFGRWSKDVDTDEI